MLMQIGGLEGTFRAHRASLADAYLMERARLEATAWSMCSSEWKPYSGEILPQALGSVAVMAQDRIIRQIINAAPRILRTRRAGAVGNVTATTGERNDNEEIEALGIRALARRAAEQAIVTGVAAFRAHTLPPEQGGRVVLSRLSGYLHPITDPDDIDIYTGLMQVWEGDEGKGYNVRIWDLEAPEYHEWRSVPDPAKVQMGTGEKVEIESPPRLAVVATDGNGLPVGEIVSGLQLLRADWAAQFRVIRVSELFGFPVPVAKGAVSMPDVWQPGGVVKTGPDGSFNFAVPTGIKDLFEHQDRITNAMREHFSLPGGVLGRGAFSGAPSGDALAEANLRFGQGSTDLAEAIDGAMGMAARDYAAITKRKRFTISVTPSTERGKDATITSVVQLRDKRLIPPSVAVRAIQPLVPGFDSEEAEAWIAQLDATSDPAALLEMLTGTGGQPE